MAIYTSTHSTKGRRPLYTSLGQRPRNIPAQNQGLKAHTARNFRLSTLAAMTIKHSPWHCQCNRFLYYSAGRLRVRRNSGAPACGSARAAVPRVRRDEPERAPGLPGGARRRGDRRCAGSLIPQVKWDQGSVPPPTVRLHLVASLVPHLLPAKYNFTF